MALPKSLLLPVCMLALVLWASTTQSTFAAAELTGDASTPVELFIILAGQMSEPEHIRIFGQTGFDCEVRHDSGINAAIRCAGQLRPGEAVNVQFHARGLAPGVGKMVVTANPDRSQPEANYDNNFIQRDIQFN